MNQPRFSSLAFLLAVFFFAVEAAAQGPFSAPIPYVDSSLLAMISVADTDGDGDLDILRSQGASTLDLLVNDGAGGFTPATVLQFVGTSNNVFLSRLGDFDGNGTTDIATLEIASNGHILKIYPGLGSLAFGAPISFSLGIFVNRLEVGRANSDGIDDLLLVSVLTPTPGGSPFTSRLQWAFGASGFALGFGSTRDTLGGVAMIADLDGDGDDDVLQRPGTSPQTELYVSYSNGTNFVDGGTLPLGAAVSPFTATNIQFGAGDVDGDGDVDVVASYVNSSQLLVSLRVFLRQGGGWTMTASQTLAGAGSNGFIQIGDWDGDGNGDLMMTQTQKQTFFRALGGGTYASGNITPVFSISDSVLGFYDLDGDGCLDFVGSRNIIFNGGSGALHAASPGVAFVDFDRDGDIDSFAANFEFRENRGSGRFISSMLPGGFLPTPPVGSFWRIRDAVDIDSDGFVDFIADRVLSNGGNGIPQGTHLLLNQRDLFLTDNGNVLGSGAPSLGTFLIAKVDSDANADLIVNGAILYGGTVTPFATSPLPQSFLASDVGDPDGDGDSDLLLVDSSLGHDLWYFANDGAANFAPTILSQSVVPDGSAKFFDFDDDGDLDVIFSESVTATTSRLVSLENLGNGMAPVRKAMSLNYSITALALSDVDTDGLVDVVTTAVPASSTNTTAGLVFRNLGGSSNFQTLPPYYANVKRLVDLDGDGDEELIGSNIFVNGTRKASDSGSYEQYGDGTPGTDGIVSVLGTRGRWKSGESIDVVASRAVGGTIGALAIGLTSDFIPSTPVAGIDTLVGNIVSVVLIGTSGQPGLGGVGGFEFSGMLPIGVSATVYLQAAFYDVGAASGFCCTNGVKIEIVP